MPAHTICKDRKGRILDHREDFWRQFQFRVTQERMIEPKKIVGQPLYGRRGLGGVQVDLQFDGRQFTSRQMQVEIIAPGGQTTLAEFALDQLK